MTRRGSARLMGSGGRLVIVVEVASGISSADFSKGHGMACCASHRTLIVVLYSASSLPWPGCHPPL